MKRKIKQFYKKIDDIAKGGYNNIREYHVLIDEVILNNELDIFYIMLEKHYFIKFKSLNNIKSLKSRETYNKILLYTNNKLDEIINKRIVKMGYVLEGDFIINDKGEKVIYIEETIDYLIGTILDTLEVIKMSREGINVGNIPIIYAGLVNEYKKIKGTI